MHETDNVMPLSRLPPGRSARVVAVKGGHGRQARLASMGVTAGVEVRMMQNSFRGPIILRVLGTRLALGRGVAAAIRVSPMPTPSSEAK